MSVASPAHVSTHGRPVPPASPRRSARQTAHADEALTEPLSALPYLSQRELTRRVDIATSGRGQYLLAAGDHEPDALLRLSADITHVGRGCGAALHLDDRSVSRRHAILVRRSGVMWVLDDRSANGVFVNGRRTTQASLHDGDELLIGRLSFTYVEH